MDSLSCIVNSNTSTNLIRYCKTSTILGNPVSFIYERVELKISMNDEFIVLFSVIISERDNLSKIALQSLF